MSLSSVQNPHSELVGALYRDHRGWLLAWLRRNVACPQRAEDLSQDTFVRLLGRPELQAPREPRAFLAAIAKGLAAGNLPACLPTVAQGSGAAIGGNSR